ncbi:hypothetical protein F8388_022148 [Cannabis sativa]|uniref:Retrotransposon Copia-like N-terminal domain-containing protein n=1 Tax=Cannabis sativa TaxID=3483 RepID=A0A7J6G7Y1_CANSA|nr:hypothetical protein F8388_022148 [Cannabis sativa]
MDPRHPENPPRSAAQPPTAAAQAPTNPPWNLFQNSLHSSLTVKLDRSNFLAWKSQVIPTVIGHGLDDILLGGHSPPERLVNGQTNPEFTIWKRKDQLLLSWLRSSMSESVLGSLAQFQSSYTACRALEQRYASQSKARILQIKSQLSTIQKGNLSIFDYLDKVKILADSLSVAGTPMDENDLIMHLLNGLGPEFDPVVVHVTSLVDDLSLESIQSLLLTHESRLERHYNLADSSTKISANLAVGSTRSATGTLNRYSASGRGTNSQYNNHLSIDKLLQCSTSFAFPPSTMIPDPSSATVQNSTGRRPTVQDVVIISPSRFSNCNTVVVNPLNRPSKIFVAVYILLEYITSNSSFIPNGNESSKNSFRILKDSPSFTTILPPAIFFSISIIASFSLFPKNRINYSSLIKICKNGAAKTELPIRCVAVDIITMNSK